MRPGDTLLAEGDAVELAPDPLMETPPEPVQALLAQYLEADEEPEVSVAADMLSDGRYGETWLAATEKRVVVVTSDNGSSKG